jgi:hypothetical protein
MMRLLASLILIGVGSFAIHTVWAKPGHSWSTEPLDQAVGIPRIVTRIMRGAVGVLFVVAGVIGILRTLKVLGE